MFRFSKLLELSGITEGRIGEVMLHARYRNSGHCPWKSMIGINRRVKRLRERTFKQWFIDSVRVGMPIEMGTDVGKKPRHPGRGHRGSQPPLPCNWSFCTKGRQAKLNIRASKCLREWWYLLLSYLSGLILPYGEICPHYNHFHHHEPLPHEWALPCQESDTLHFSELRDLGAFPISYTHIYTPSHHQNKYYHQSILQSSLLDTIASQKLKVQADNPFRKFQLQHLPCSWPCGTLTASNSLVLSGNLTCPSNGIQTAFKWTWRA